MNNTTRIAPQDLAKLKARAKAIATQGHVPPSQLTTTSPQRGTKLEMLRRHFTRGDYRAALRIAARFPELGAERDAILLAHGAYINPRFYAGLGHDIKTLIDAGVAALRSKYGLGE